MSMQDSCEGLHTIHTLLLLQYKSTIKTLPRIELVKLHRRYNVDKTEENGTKEKWKEQGAEKGEGKTQLAVRQIWDRRLWREIPEVKHN